MAAARAKPADETPAEVAKDDAKAAPAVGAAVEAEATPEPVDDRSEFRKAAADHAGVILKFVADTRAKLDELTAAHASIMTNVHAAPAAMDGGVGRHLDRVASSLSGLGMVLDHAAATASTLAGESGATVV